MSEHDSSCVGSEQIKTLKGKFRVVSTTKVYAVDIEVKDDTQAYLLGVTVEVTSDETGCTLYETDVPVWHGLDPEDYPGNDIAIEEFACAEAERLVRDWSRFFTEVEVDCSNGEERVIKKLER